MKPHIRKGGKGQETYYLNIPKEIVKSLNIKPDDEFILNVEQKDGDLVLAYRRMKK